MNTVNNIKQTINFVYFTANFPSNFIEQVWEGNQHLIDHLTAKFNSIVKRADEGFVSPGTFLKFVFELDGENKETLVEWVENNYKSGFGN